jgi:hypothetical protein
MTVYSSPDDVAALTPRYANTSGVFDSTTRPTNATVTTLLAQIAAVIDSLLAAQGFSLPITQVTAKTALDLFVAQEVAAIVEGINGSGRFGPTAKTTGNRGRFALVFDDAKEFIEASAVGFERLGAARGYTPASGIGYRDTDVAGDETFPIFQRDGFDNVFTNWDSD